MNSLADVWSAVCEECRKSISEAGFNVWIKVITPIELNSGEVVLALSNEFKRDVVEKNYKQLLKDCFNSVLGFPVEVRLVVENQANEPQQAPSDPHSIYTFENFVVGSSNRFAHAASLAVAENPSVVYNPLFIYGNSGVGKTHLLLAITNHISKKFPEKRIEYVRGEDFTNALIEAIHQGTMQQFHNRFRTVDVLLVDDIQFIAGKESTQEEFFNTFNTLYQNNKQMVLSSDRPPKDIKTLDERIRSRFESGLLADIAPPDFETRVGIIRQKAELLGITLDENITYYIAEQIKMNTRQLEGVVKKLQAYIKIQHGEPTITVVQNFIKDIKNDTMPDPITVDKIIAEVARTYSVSENDIRSSKRHSPLPFVRFVAMYITRELTQMSYSAIGKSFNKDHTTVLYAIDKVEETLKTNSHERRIVEDIIKNLQQMYS
ncbi:MAG TPA: chromosomal replication initiator protein DnaA [Clostridiales bacterium]|nr:chromosomal replication initiator protein DnaA [Clostridiales bacterium]